MAGVHHSTAYRDIAAKLTAAGIARDDAHVAARIVERAYLDRRDEMIIKAVKSGAPPKEVGVIWGLSKVHIYRILRASNITSVAE